MEFPRALTKHWRKQRLRTTFEFWAYPVAILTLCMSIPQIWDVWINQNVQGIAPLTWFSWMIGNVFWIIYGKLHNDKPIFYLYLGWFLVNSLVFVGSLLFK
jgi:uncharacterized protein with PQ loop repeat